jgi:hypothetical protein
MRMLRGLFFAVFISVMLAMIISFLPTVDLQDVILEQSKKDIEQPVFNSVKPIHLDETELVPYLQQLQLYYDFKKVQIDGHELFIDSKMTSEEFNQELIYRDALQMVKETFHQTSNINKLYIRFILLREYQPALLVAVTSERRDELIQAIKKGLEPEEMETFLKKFTKIDYGTGWSN